MVLIGLESFSVFLQHHPLIPHFQIDLLQRATIRRQREVLPTVEQQQPTFTTKPISPGQHAMVCRGTVTKGVNNILCWITTFAIQESIHQSFKRITLLLFNPVTVTSVPYESLHPQLLLRWWHRITLAQLDRSLNSPVKLSWARAHTFGGAGSNNIAHRTEIPFPFDNQPANLIRPTGH